MSTPTEHVTTATLREWGLPDPGGSKKSRGQVVVVGGSRLSPGAVLLAGQAALRVGAGRVALAVPGDIEAGLGLAMPEAGVYVLPAPGESLPDELGSTLASADAVLFGSGFDDPDTTIAALRSILDADISCLVLDAFALGVIDRIDRADLPAELILNANQDEAEILLGRELGDDRAADLREIARAHDAVVHCYGVVAAPDGSTWRVEPGGPGLGTAGSGDVLAGAITGFAARGVGAQRAAVWGGWAHARAGDVLEEGGIGYLARELPAALTGVVADALR